MNLTHTDRFCRNLDWNLLFVFFVLVEEKSVTKAAKRLLVSQPAVSNALKRLEAQFDCTLIERSARRFALSEAGRLLYEEAAQMRGSVSRIAVALKDVTDEITGHVTISVATHAESPVIDAALRQFHTNHPRATLSIQVVTSGDILTAVRRKTVTCGIGLAQNKVPELDYEMIYRERFALYCGKSSDLFGKQILTSVDVVAQPYVTFPTDEPGGDMHDFAVARRDFGITSTPVGRSYHLEELRRLIEIGVGIGPLPFHVAQRYVAMGRLWEIPIAADLPVFDVSLITNPRTCLNPSESAFIDILRVKIAERSIQERSYL
ncbi:LysR family transcriptional regulator [Roseobacter fucihabitans]|uniref:LysR family transcriptional regulator n=1 Tax=Roseobacter fucihabitans TaxID=1537242 RepID=UPI001652E3A6|nr:LysR family transcriptional regulator [Roseobacter litoralis]